MPANSDISKTPRASEFEVEGMTCGNCVRHVMDAAQSVPGVRSASADLQKKSLSVRWQEAAVVTDSLIIAALDKTGYPARPKKILAQQEPSPASADPCCTQDSSHARRSWHLAMWVGVIGTALMMVGEWIFGLSFTRWFQWFSFFLATIVQIIAGSKFYRGAWNQLRHGRSNMDTLVALGSTTAYGYSVWAFFTAYGGHLYFMEGAAIISLVSLGHWVESLVSQKASSALRLLMNLAPATARRLDATGGEHEILARALAPGDIFSLRPGDTSPTDGSVVEGESAVDESMLTGESAPVNKKAGSEIYAGTVNVNGRLAVRATVTGEQTALAHIIEAVERAQSSRANIQKLGDRVSSVFVPLVVLVAIASGLWWGLGTESALQTHQALSGFLWHVHLPASSLAAGFIIAASVLIVACPCAMGLATPAAIMAGANAASRRGILIRDGLVFEQARTITTVVFDKTGTLTIGKPAVVQSWTSAQSPDWPATRAGKLAASLARNSSHPLSKALCAHIAGAEGELPTLQNWREVRGAGLEAHFATGTEQNYVRLGSLEWLESLDVETGGGASFAGEWSARGATVIGLSLGSGLLAAFALQDALKPGVKGVVQELLGQGLAVHMLTGDQPETANFIAAECGIPSDQVHARVRPEQKAEWIKTLQSRGEKVAFVGDGINDAPALEQADLGIAVCRASDIAREAADIILLKTEIEAVPEALSLAKTTLRIIKQNLFWAFFYNALGVPLAALGFMSPVVCAAAMGFSDIIVVGNALRLLRWKYRRVIHPTR